MYGLDEVDDAIAKQLKECHDRIIVLSEINKHLQLLIRSAYYELREHDGNYHYQSSEELLDEMSKWIGD